MSNADLAAIIATGDSEALAKAIAAGTDVTRPLHLTDGRAGTYPVVYAARQGRVESVRALLDAGADPDSTDQSPQPTSALRAATLGDHLAVARLLLERGATIEDDPLHDVRYEVLTRTLIWASPRSFAVLELLLDATGVDVTGEPLLAVAAKRDAPRSVIDLLLGHGASPDTRRRDGTPALVIAARLNHQSLVDSLLASGADPDLEDPAGWTALMHAADLGWNTVVVSLRLAGAQIAHRAPDGANALDLARYWGHQHVQMALGEHHTVPRPVKGRSPTIVASPRGWQLSGPPARLEQLAVLVDHAITTMGYDYGPVVGPEQNGRDLVEKLRTDTEVLTRPPGAATIRLTRSEARLLRLSLLQYGHFPNLDPPPGHMLTEIQDLHALLTHLLRR